jgi:hypothetical protein
MIDQKKIITTILISFIFGIIGFFFDFQVVKGNVYAIDRKIMTIDRELEKLDDIKELQCEVAIELFSKSENKPAQIIKHCRHR